MTINYVRLAGSTVGRMPDPEFQPFGAYAWRCRKHCEDAHGATREDYKLDVKGWHNRNHAECDQFPKYGSAQTP